MENDRWKRFLKDWAMAYQQDYHKKTRPEAQGLLVAQGIISSPSQSQFTVPYLTFREFIIQRAPCVESKPRASSTSHTLMSSPSLSFIPGIASSGSSEIKTLCSDPTGLHQTLPLTPELCEEFLHDDAPIWKELQYLPTDKLVLYKPGTTNIFKISRATLNQLVALLVIDVQPNKIIEQYDYIQLFFWIFPGFATPQQLFNKFTDLWRAEPVLSALPGATETTLKLAILQCLRHWIVTFPLDFDAALIKDLTTLLRTASHQPVFARHVSRIREEILSRRRSSIAAPPQAPELPAESASIWQTVSLLEVNLKLVAQQLSIRALNSFRKISRAEFAAWLHDDYSRAPNLAFFNARFEVLINKMTSGILACQSAPDRLQLIQRAVELGLEMFNLNNIQDGLAVASCLIAGPVSRLTADFDALPTRHKQTLEVFQRHLLRSEDPVAFNIWQLSLPRPSVLYLQTFRAQFFLDSPTCTQKMIDLEFYSRVYSLFYPISTRILIVYPYASDPLFGKLLQRLKTMTLTQQNQLSQAYLQSPRKNS